MNALKNITNLSIGIIVCGCLALSSCEDFLDTTDYLNKNDSNFPKTEEDLSSLLTGLYGTMIRNSTGGTFLLGGYSSDEQFGGGGTVDMLNHGITTMLKTSENMLSGNWSNLYSGIYNANKLLEVIDVVEFQNETERTTIKGEAHFMRAYFYSELTKLFGDVPLYTTTEVSNIPRTPAKEIFAVIASDLKLAIELLPNTPIQGMAASRLGHATKWAAEAFLAREFLFYTGYYKDTAMPLSDGSTLSKDEVINYLNDCISNSGHGLVPDFRSLWFYTNEATGDDYPYNKETGSVWIGEDLSNVESVFAMKFNVNGSWGNPYATNYVSVCFGLRNLGSLADGFPFGYGYGYGPVNSRFAEEWKAEDPDDIRYKTSIIDLNDPSEGIPNYDEGFDMSWETGYILKKYAPMTCWRNADKTEAWPAACELFGAKNDSYFSNLQDIYLIRFADVLLMHSELTQTVDGINRVRARVGLEPIGGYSFEALNKERHHELAFEGVRYYDLFRWYGPDQAGAIVDRSKNGVVVEHANVPTVVNLNLTKRVKETGGFLQIPQSQINLLDGVLTQNPGWALPDILFSW